MRPPQLTPIAEAGSLCWFQLSYPKKKKKGNEEKDQGNQIIKYISDMGCFTVYLVKGRILKRWRAPAQNTSNFFFFKKKTKNLKIPTS